MRLTAAEVVLNELNEVFLADLACIRFIFLFKKRGKIQPVFSRQVSVLVALPEKLYSVEVVLTTVCATLRENRDSPFEEQLLGDILLNCDWRLRKLC